MEMIFLDTCILIDYLRKNAEIVEFKRRLELKEENDLKLFFSPIKKYFKL